MHHDASHLGPRLRGDDGTHRVAHSPGLHAPVASASLVLLGTGTVGSAFLQRLARLAPVHDEVRALRLTAVANSRAGWIAPSAPGIATIAAADAIDVEHVIASQPSHRRVIVIDATASDAVAARHAGWLAAGASVATASKLGTGAALARWRAIRAAQLASGAGYGDAATVGAGLPILRTLRELRRGGDRVHAIAGTLSGSLAWLFSRYDGDTPFASLVAQAQARGYTEPDPREDLSGGDVRRKLLILARAAGDELGEHEVSVESLVGVDEAAFAACRRPGHVLRYIARWHSGSARIGLEALSPDDPLAQGDGCDNRIALWTDRYRERPLLLQGPGAGAEVTAAALLDDVLALARAL